MMVVEHHEKFLVVFWFVRFGLVGGRLGRSRCGRLVRFAVALFKNK
jgi:hypothetical protein